MSIMNSPDLNSMMQETLNCLTKTFQSVDKIEREAAEQKLKEFEGDLMTHFKVILEAIKEESLISSKKI
jgi:hypothetical protein